MWQAAACRWENELFPWTFHRPSAHPCGSLQLLSRENTAVFLEGGETNHHSVLLVHRHLIADPFSSLGRSGLDHFANLLKRGSRVLRKRSKIFVYSLLVWHLVSWLLLQ